MKYCGCRRWLVSALSGLLAATALAWVAGCDGGGDSDSGGGGDPTAGRVVFVGASITDGWDFDGYFPGRDFRKVIHYSADKTEVWTEVARQAPAIVVVKECAAYFYAEGGTPLAEYQDIVTRMVGLIRGIGAAPVLATTIPVDIGQGDCTAAQLADIHAFNAWMRSTCAAEGIVCLDLDAAIADSEGQLPTACHDGDGLHPNETGYNLLSPAVIPALQNAGL